MVTTKQLNIKNRTYYFHDDLFNLKNLDLNPLNLDKKSLTEVNVYCIEYITTTKDISDCENITSVNPLYIIINDIYGYIEENNGNKYLFFASTDKNRKVLKKYLKLWDEIRYRIQTTNASKFGEYGRNYMRIKFDSDDNLPLNKILKFRVLTIIIKSVFGDDGKYYPQILLDDCLYQKDEI